jgi:hypothetical protein
MYLEVVGVVKGSRVPALSEPWNPGTLDADPRQE